MARTAAKTHVILFLVANPSETDRLVFSSGPLPRAAGDKAKRPIRRSDATVIRLLGSQCAEGNYADDVLEVTTKPQRGKGRDGACDSPLSRSEFCTRPTTGTG